MKPSNLSPPRTNKTFQIRIIKGNSPSLRDDHFKPKLQAKSLSPRPKSPHLLPKINQNCSHFEELLRSSLKKKHFIIISELSKSIPPPISLNIIINQIKLIIIKILEKSRISETIETLLMNIKTLKAPRLMVYGTLILAKILYKFNDFVECQRFLQMIRFTIASLPEFTYKAKRYKYMSLSLMAQKEFFKARKYSLKLLKIALIFNKENIEGYAYDMLGKIYFYMKDLKKATEYHEKMLNCKKTPEIINICTLLRSKFQEKHCMIDQNTELFDKDEEKAHFHNKLNDNRTNNFNTHHIRTDFIKKSQRSHDIFDKSPELTTSNNISHFIRPSHINNFQFSPHLVEMNDKSFVKASDETQRTHDESYSIRKNSLNKSHFLAQNHHKGTHFYKISSEDIHSNNDNPYKKHKTHNNQEDKLYSRRNYENSDNSYANNSNNSQKELLTSSDEDLDLLDNMKENDIDGNMRAKTTVFKGGLYSHMSYERGDPKENLQDYRGDEKKGRLKGLKKAVRKVIEQGEIKQANLKRASLGL